MAEALALGGQVALVGRIGRHLVGELARHADAQLAQPAPDLFPDVTAAVRALLAERYTVYDDEASVPPEYRSTDEIGITYVSGFLFHFEVRILRPGVVEVTYSDFESSIAGSRQTVSYRWRRGRWTTLFRGRVFVA